MKAGRPKGKGKAITSNHVGALVRRARLEQALGLADVAKKLGVSVQFVSNIEHGRAPLPFKLITKTSKYLGISQHDLTRAAFASSSAGKHLTALGFAA